MWTGESITFRRTLDGSTVQPFRGIVVDGGDGKMKMAGRFAAAFEGVWSATCSSGQSTPPPADTGGATPPPPPTDLQPTPPTTGACSIAGSATGPRASVAGVFNVTLMGPDSDRTMRARQPLASGSYRFTGLPNGKYVLIADTKADVSVHVVPRRQT